MSMTRRRRGEAGFTLVTVMGTMVIGALLTVAAFAAVDGDARESGKDVARKQALAAAESGVNEYLFKLNGDNNYWATCANPGAGVNNIWDGQGTDPRAWRNVPGASSKYTIELIPANGNTQCQPGPNVAASMIDAGSRSLRIRVTGRAPSPKGFVNRSIIATLKRDGFLDFLWFTDYETRASAWYSLESEGRPTGGTQGDLITWASTACKKYWRNGRDSVSWSGKFTDASGGNLGPVKCSKIQFAPGDVLAGPVHTNDDLYTCEKPTFGRVVQDRIESGDSYRPACSNVQPNFKGTFLRDQATIGMPATNSALATFATPQYTFSGATTIRFGTTPDKMTVTNVAKGLVNVAMDYPENGVIYVKASGSCPAYQAYDPYTGTQNCGNALVSGSYERDLTIATANDIVVNGDLTKASTSDALMGLIADGFIRVEHRVSSFNGGADPPTCNTVTAGNRRIDAAMLTLQHSFTVDYYYCGGAIGTLTVNGVIAQRFRGTVGTGNATSTTSGYVKDYNYDDRLTYRAPPHFLDPVQSAWRIARYTEQQPARR
jgi:hypothetical protein